MDIPTALPSGETVWRDHEFIKMLHEGKPEVGWIGDDRLMPYYGPDSTIELRRRDEQGNMRLVAKSRPGVKYLGMDTIIWLAEHDPQSRKAYNLANDVNSHNARIQAGIDGKKKEVRDEAVDRLAHALLKDLGPYETGSSRRFFQGIDVPKGGAK